MCHCFRLKHPAVLELHSYFEDSNYVYLVLEMCDAGEMYRYMKEAGEHFSETQGKSHLSLAVAKLHGG